MFGCEFLETRVFLFDFWPIFQHKNILMPSKSFSNLLDVRINAGWYSGECLKDLGLPQKLMELIGGTNHKGWIRAGGSWATVVEGEYLLSTISGSIVEVIAGLCRVGKNLAKEEEWSFNPSC